MSKPTQTVVTHANSKYWETHSLLHACQLIAERFDDDEEGVVELRTLLGMAIMSAMDIGKAQEVAHV